MVLSAALRLVFAQHLLCKPLQLPRFHAAIFLALRRSSDGLPVRRDLQPHDENDLSIALIGHFHHVGVNFF